MASIHQAIFTLLLLHTPSSTAFLPYRPLSLLTKNTFTTEYEKSQYTIAPLFGKVKKGALRKNFDSDDAAPRTTKTKKTSKKSTAAVSTTGSVSPALAQWASQPASTTTPPPSPTKTEISTDDDDENSATYSTFKQKKRSERRERQREKQKRSSGDRAALASILSELEESLENTKDIKNVLTTVDKIVNSDLGSDNTRSITASPIDRDYRMVWVGSDESVCHLGTGLHNVPLARLQEVFLTVGGSGIELKEIIRILGPFPNVKNTLVGTTSVGKKVLKITYDSMIDGTGKEVLAGKEENKKIVMLEVLFASEDCLVCRVPNEDGEAGARDISEGDGKDIILFLKEEDLQGQLDVYRVV